MRSHSHATPAPGLLAMLLSLLAPCHVYAQTASYDQGPACEIDVEDPIIASISMARRLSDDRRVLAALDDLEPIVRAGALAGPDDTAAQYALAALLGARIEHEGGRRKMGTASEMRTQALRVLDLEPGHAGASYLLGRLHAAVMRMSGLTRFFATKVLGGSALKGASWDQGQALLEAAEREGPCNPEHHFELARLYADRHNYADAERECRHVLDLAQDGDARWYAIRQQAERLPAEWRGRSR